MPSELCPLSAFVAVPLAQGQEPGLGGPPIPTLPQTGVRIRSW